MELKEMYDRQFARVYRVCLLYLGNVQDAEDVVQNVFLKAFERQISFQDLEHEKAWFLTVARHDCTDVLRSFWRRKRTSLTELTDQESMQESQEEPLFTKMMELPEKYREILYLYYYEEYSVRELSQLLHRKESTIQTQLADGRRKLKVVLKSEESREGEMCS